MPPKFTEQQLKDALLIDMNSLEPVYKKELSDSPGHVPIFVQFPQARPLTQEQLMEDDDAKASYTGGRRRREMDIMRLIPTLCVYIERYIAVISNRDNCFLFAFENEKYCKF